MLCSCLTREPGFQPSELCKPDSLKVRNLCLIKAGGRLYTENLIWTTVSWFLEAVGSTFLSISIVQLCAKCNISMHVGYNILIYVYT